MTLWNIPGQGIVDDRSGDISEDSVYYVDGQPQHATRVPSYENPSQYASEAGGVQWSPQSGTVPQVAYADVGYGPKLLDFAARAKQGTLLDYERQEYEAMRQAALAIPTRDIEGLYAGGYSGLSSGGRPSPEIAARFPGAYPGDRPNDLSEAQLLSPSHPDFGAILLQLSDKVQAGTATQHERALFENTRRDLNYQNYTASAPQESDANPFGLGDQLFGALMTLGMGAGMAGLAPLAAGTITAGSLGAAGSTLGGIASLIGPPTGQEWLTKAGQALGLTSTLASLPTLLSKGVGSLSDVARLASASGRAARGLGGLTGNDALAQAGDVLGLGGALSGGIDTLRGGVSSLTDAGRLAQLAGQVAGPVGRLTGSPGVKRASSLLGLGGRLAGNVEGLLGAAGQAQQRGTAPVERTMNEDNWLGKDWQPGPWQQPQSVLWNL